MHLLRHGVQLCRRIPDNINDNLVKSATLKFKFHLPKPENVWWSKIRLSWVHRFSEGFQSSAVVFVTQIILLHKLVVTMDIIGSLSTVGSFCIIQSVYQPSLANTLRTVHQCRAESGFPFSAAMIIFSNVSALLQMLKPPKCLCCSWHFMCFTGAITQLCTKFNADTLFHFEVSEGAIKHAAQSTSMRNNHKIPTGPNLLDCQGDN